MKTQLRKSSERGFFDFNWLKTYHSFSFGEYQDPQWMGFKTLRVINEDFIDAKGGFAPHGHRDMEIISYLIQGELKHEDSMGNGSVIRPNEAQYMSAGSGVRHSEFNPSLDQKTHLLQLWIHPSEKGLPPRYQQIHFDEKEKHNQWKRIASPDGQKNSLAIRQDAHVFVSELEQDHPLDYNVQKNRSIWIQLIQGQIQVKHNHSLLGVLHAGDALALDSIFEENLKIDILCTKGPSHFLLFDLTDE